MSTWTALMLMWASSLSGYSIPGVDQRPIIIDVSHKYFVQNVCHGIDTKINPCNYVGLYTYKTHTIHIDKGLSKKEYDNITVHELVHYLQHVHDKYVKDTCVNRLAREHEAYGVEQQYVNQVQDPQRILYPPDDNEICKLS